MLTHTTMLENPFAFCDQCRVANKCCRQLGPGFKLAPPFVSETEIEGIRRSLNSEASHESAFFSSMGRGMTHIQTNRCGSCIFHANMRCTIYDARPFDCRIFPLDIVLIDGKYFWIGYTEFCEQEIDWEALLAYGEGLLRQGEQGFIGKFAEDTRRMPPGHRYRVLKEILP